MNPKTVRIVTTGDSMTDTAGPEYPALAAELAGAYPDRTFDVINHGVGSTRAGYGLWRLTHAYEFNGQSYPPLVSLDPDIVAVESFAYNNGSDGLHGDGLAHFRAMHHAIVKTLRDRTRARIVIVVTIAPDPDRFLETVPCFMHTPKAILRWMAEDRMRYLEAAVEIAGELELPLANVYAATLEARDRGVPLGTFINPADWIHPGPEGHALTARLIVAAIRRHGLIA